MDKIGIFGMHSMLIAILGTCFAQTIWTTGLILSARISTNIKAYKYLLLLSEDKMFWSGMIFFSACFLAFAVLILVWGLHGFKLLTLEKETLLITGIAINGLLMITGVITSHIIRRT